MDGEQLVQIGRYSVLEKKAERWWKSVVKGGKEIDTTKVDSTKNIDEYDGETQGAIRKLMWEQEQKRQHSGCQMNANECTHLEVDHTS